jgi:hypothetical protein
VNKIFLSRSVFVKRFTPDRYVRLAARRGTAYRLDVSLRYIGPTVIP